MEGWMGPCGIDKKQRNKCGCWIHDVDHATYTYLEQELSWLWCSFPRWDFCGCVAVSAFWLESCLAPLEKEVKAFPNLQFPVFKVYFVNSKKQNASYFKWAAAFLQKESSKGPGNWSQWFLFFPQPYENCLCGYDSVSELSCLVGWRLPEKRSRPPASQWKPPKWDSCETRTLLNT